MDVRPAVDEDLPAIAKIATANDDDAGADPRYVSHLRNNGLFLVAEADGALVGYCGIRRTAEATMLTDLFVDPDRHGGGAGRRLLEVALGGAGERFTFASRDPRAMSLYVRYGMVPRWPLLYLSGPPAGAAALRAERVTLDEAGAAERALTGRDRTADYAYWATTPKATGLVVRDEGKIAATGAAAPDGLFHLVTGDGHDPAATLTAALTTFEAARVRVCLPGPHPALPYLLEARWRIEDLDQYLSTRTDLVSPASVLSPSLA
ncbi:GNAT family N-acetyltransferase [Actinomadura sp. DC4]|uniref:GNAT family N-acetyltransferase n=1 Tax=Actinomadura sp. DC4 TaxID=3055069 RepID=UPI0025B20CA5|nr:GNAT family N-acetyltransferase [Actinomadura sp. DC4]MDN3355980.1 GNAT family N-acetyltransferase [Actinomadura sp. DC4]